MHSEFPRNVQQHDLRLTNRYLLPGGAVASFSLYSPPRHHSYTEEGEAVLVDLSIGGCKLRSHNSLACSIYYKMILQLPRYPRPINIESATIRWVDEQTFGVRFTRVDMHDVEHLHTFLLQMHTATQLPLPRPQPEHDP